MLGEGALGGGWEVESGEGQSAERALGGEEASDAGRPRRVTRKQEMARRKAQLARERQEKQELQRRQAHAAMEAAAQGKVCVPGLARTKPGRGERTCCMSCSDKLARWHAVGLQAV